MNYIGICANARDDDHDIEELIQHHIIIVVE